MNFNLLIIMTLLKQHYGNDAEILIMQEDAFIKFRLRVLKSGEFYAAQFVIAKTELTDSKFDIIKEHLDDCIQSINHLIKEASDEPI